MHIPTSGAWLTRSSPNVVAIVTMLIYVRKSTRWSGVDKLARLPDSSGLRDSVRANRLELDETSRLLRFCLQHDRAYLLLAFAIPGPLIVGFQARWTSASQFL